MKFFTLLVILSIALTYVSAQALTSRKNHGKQIQNKSGNEHIFEPTKGISTGYSKNLLGDNVLKSLAQKVAEDKETLEFLNGLVDAVAAKKITDQKAAEEAELVAFKAAEKAANKAALKAARKAGKKTLKKPVNQETVKQKSKKTEIAEESKKETELEEEEDLANFEFVEDAKNIPTDKPKKRKYFFFW